MAELIESGRRSARFLYALAETPIDDNQMTEMQGI